MKVSFVLFAFALVQSANAAQPNIVMVFADDMGYADIGYHGDDIPTPHLVSLANQGVILENYYVSPMCTPSRACLFSGHYEIHHGLSHMVIKSLQPSALPDDSPILSEKLKEAGYSTHMVGKWHLGHFKAKYLPQNRGFDTFYGCYLGAGDHYNHTSPAAKTDIYNAPWYLDLHDNNGPIPSERGSYSTHLFTKKAIEAIENKPEDKPLFLYLSHQTPHSPLQVPSKYFSACKPGMPQKRCLYAAMMAALDEGVENVTQALKDNGLWDNTIFIFSTDNGGDPFYGASNLPLSGRKGMLWEGGVRGVGFVAGGAVQASGVVNKDLFHITDWFPSLMAAAGGNTDGTKPLDGVDQWDTIANGAPGKRDMLLHNIDVLASKWKQPLYDDTFDTSTHAAIRVGDLKLITGAPLPLPYHFWKRLPGNWEKNYWMFNITADPSEQNDISEQNPEAVRNILGQLDALQKTAVAPWYPADDPAGDPAVNGGVWQPWIVEA